MPVLCPLVPCALAMVAAAQTPPSAESPVTRTQRFARVTAGSPTEQVSCAAFNQHGLTPCGEQSLIAPISRSTWPDAKREGAARTRLELWRSDDGGITWRRVAEGPDEPSAAGGIIAEPGGKLVHCMWWTSHNEGGSVRYQAFDTTQNTFVGAPQLIAKAVDRDCQYIPYDMERTADGTVVLCVGNYANVEAPWISSWSSGLYWLKPGANTFAGPRQINPQDTGCLGTIQVRGNRVATTYRTVRSRAVICLRWFDVDKEQPIGGESQVSAPDLETNNGSAITIDDAGAITVLYVTGDGSAGNGRLGIAHSANGSGTDWIHHELAQDPPLRGGNYNDCHFVLARGPGPQAVAYYSKEADGHDKLYRRLIDGGKPIGPEKVVAEGGTIKAITSLRSSVASSSVQVLLTRESKAVPYGEVVAYGLMPARNIWSAR